MKLPRNLAALSLVLVLPLAFACAPADETAEVDDAMEETGEPAATPAPVTPEPTPTMEPMTSQITALGEAPLTGEIRIQEAGDAQTDVTITLTGSEAGAVHQGMIHSGTCDNIGGVIAPLDPLTIGDDAQGEVTTTVSTPTMSLSDGNHAVVYHEANGTPGAPVACAPIPAHTM